MAGQEITDFDEVMKHVDYRMWFSDEVVDKYLPSFAKRYNNAKSEAKKKTVLEEANLCALNYSLLVYYLYDANPNFRKSIDSDVKLRKNFESIKRWLSAYNAKKGADDFINDLLATAIISAK